MEEMDPYESMDMSLKLVQSLVSHKLKSIENSPTVGEDSKMLEGIEDNDQSAEEVQ